MKKLIASAFAVAALAIPFAGFADDGTVDVTIPAGDAGTYYVVSSGGHAGVWEESNDVAGLQTHATPVQGGADIPADTQMELDVE